MLGRKQKEKGYKLGFVFCGGNGGGRRESAWNLLNCEENLLKIRSEFILFISAFIKAQRY